MSEIKWGLEEREINLRDANIVCITEEWGTITRQLPLAILSEGRVQTSYPLTEDEQTKPDEIKYQCFIGLKETHSEEWRSVASKIVLTAIHESGTLITVQGDGWAGFGDRGDIELLFDVPPEITMPRQG
mgnify:CR=1 FL=1